MHTNTSTEYWQAGNSLVTTDPLGKRDEALPDNVRVYTFASTQHIFAATMPRGVCALPPNLEIDPRPAMRSLLLALDRWAKDGTAPPPSSYPRIADGTLVAVNQLKFPKIPGVALPVEPNPKERFDYGPDDGKGVLAPLLGFALSFLRPMGYDYVDWKDPLPAVKATADSTRGWVKGAVRRTFSLLGRSAS
jgi:hypothetical protein